MSEIEDALALWRQLKRRFGKGSENVSLELITRCLSETRTRAIEDAAKVADGFKATVWGFQVGQAIRSLLHANKEDV